MSYVNLADFIFTFAATVCNSKPDSVMNVLPLWQTEATLQRGEQNTFISRFLKRTRMLGILLSDLDFLLS